MNKQGNLCYKDSISHRLIERIQRVCSDPDRLQGGLCRFTVEVKDLAPVQWLALQNDAVKVYYSQRDGNSEIAGVGIADIVTDDSHLDLKESLGAIEDRIAYARCDLRYYGGICFDPDNPADGDWVGFGKFCFIVPTFEFRRQGDKATFSYNLLRTPDDTPESAVHNFLSAFDRLVFDGCEDLSEPDRPKILNRSNIPDKSAWGEVISRAISDLSDRNMDKIVLARKSVLRMSRPFDPVLLMNEVRQRNTNSYDFCFQRDDHDAFIGSSPECLFSRQGRNIYSEAIAGTCRTGDSDKERKYHQDKLSSSAKETEEHGYVFDNVKADLAKICSEINVVDERSIVSLSYVQHFCSRFSGLLNDNVSTYDIIEALHPTAAVNGFPKETAKEEIRKCETFSRGWYAGPIGWIGEDSSEFAVGIRSARIKDNEISLFAGAGLVRASDPRMEWEETENKLSLFLDVIESYAKDK